MRTRTPASAEYAIGEETNDSSYSVLSNNGGETSFARLIDVRDHERNFFFTKHAKQIHLGRKPGTMITQHYHTHCEFFFFF